MRWRKLQKLSSSSPLAAAADSTPSSIAADADAVHHRGGERLEGRQRAAEVEHVVDAVEPDHDLARIGRLGGTRAAAPRPGAALAAAVAPLVDLRAATA